ncbi:MAG: GTP cyclohydrolase I FolE [Candidatus Poseidoniales archaeon]|jgi:GTP cyclohydrolase I|nr:GTP cyclohydrolase I FolE [Candidatus Poseidoniales archaeon]|tara:strand:+ start:128 stop:718 length:591 start_codon:yes stop_codon:yes gene_type:complete
MKNGVPNREDAQNAIEILVRYIEKIDGPLREGLLDTPRRVIDAYEELYQGYNIDAVSLLEATFNAEGYDGIVLLRDIEFYSTCEHHMLPFTGSAHVAYIPVENIVGISKLARLVDLHALRLQNQERITKSIADDLERVLQPLGCAVIIEAKHGCMQCRGVKKQNSVMTTSSMKGVFFDNAEARVELLQLIKNPRNN